MRCCRAAPWGPLRRMTYDAATLKYAPKPQPPQPHPTTPWDHFSLTPTLVTLSHFHPLSHAAALRSRGPTTCALQSPGSNFLRLWSATVTALPSPQLQSLPEKLQLPASVPWREPRRRPRHLHMLSAFGCQSGRRRPKHEQAGGAQRCGAARPSRKGEHGSVDTSERDRQAHGGGARRLGQRDGGDHHAHPLLSPGGSKQVEGQGAPTSDRARVAAEQQNQDGPERPGRSAASEGGGASAGIIHRCCGGGLWRVGGVGGRRRHRELLSYEACVQGEVSAVQADGEPAATQAVVRHARAQPRSKKDDAEPGGHGGGALGSQADGTLQEIEQHRK
eukprot:scaffold7558_cov109-Isochrysis_galbana.AAC.9